MNLLPIAVCDDLEEERALLDPISRLIAQKKSVREEEADYE